MGITILFYGSIFLSLCFLTIAILKSSWKFLFVSIFFAFPYSFYFSGYPHPLLRLAIFIPVIYVAIFYFVKKLHVKSP